MKIRFLGNVDNNGNMFVAGDESEIGNNQASILIKCKMAEEIIDVVPVVEPVSEQKEEIVNDIPSSEEQPVKAPKRRVRRKKIEPVV